MNEDEKQIILDWVKQQKKTKHYFNDLCKAVPEMEMMQAKKVVNELVSEGKLRYWSSGGTTMYMLLSEGDVAKEEKGMNEDEKQMILDWVKQQKETKHYFNDLCKAVPEMEMMQAKKVVNELVSEGKLRYWSSGGTTMYMLPSEGDVAKEEKGMNEPCLPQPGHELFPLKLL